MSIMSDMRKKTEAELIELVTKARETIRTERFKDKFSKKAHVIRTAKKEVARALTELTARTNGTTK